MNKSMKQIADELGVDKQQVYRFINKECINETTQQGKTKLYDETAQTRIIEHFKAKSSVSQSTTETNQSAYIETLLKQIETLENDKKWLQDQIAVKDKQIKSWEGAAAQFSMQSTQPPLLESSVASQPVKKPWWRRKGKVKKNG